VLTLIPNAFPSDGYFEELRTLLEQAFPDQLTIIGKTHVSISSRIPEWVKWGATGALFLLAVIYFFLVYFGIASLM